MRKLINIILVFFLAYLVTACGGDSNSTTNEIVEDDPPAPTTLVDVASASDSFTTLVAALDAAGLVDTLADVDGSFTVFAPSDEAFAAFLESAGLTADELLASPDLEDILLYHVVVDSVIDSAAALDAAGTTVTMGNGSLLGVHLEGGELFVNLSQVVETDITADNGVIHVIDTVLTPPAVDSEPTETIADIVAASADSMEPEFTTLLAALQATELDAVLANPEASFTVFAPTDAAFEMFGSENVAALLGDTDALAAILTQHVVAAEVTSPAALALNGTAAMTVAETDVAIEVVDRALRVGGAAVTTVDIFAANGVIHVIDTVLIEDLPVVSPEETIAGLVTGLAGAETPEFSILLQALVAADLAGVLDGEDAFTVFAPTDAAFTALLTEAGITAETLLARDDLAEILLYHVLPGTVLLDSAKKVAYSDMPVITMANDAMAAGNTAALSESDAFYVNTSAVIDPNVLAANGVVHVIDKVLLPQALADDTAGTIADVVVAATTADTPEFTTLLAAVQAAGLDGALADPDATFTVFAPTDEAFAALLVALETTAEDLLADVDTLTSVLNLHLIADTAVDSITAFSLNPGDAPTVGGPVPLEIVDGNLTIGGATVVTTDVSASNGIIHVIDAVITE